MSCQDRKSAQTERAALIKARFGFGQAFEMLGLSARTAADPDRRDPCPSCRAPGVTFLSAATVPSAMGAMLLPTDEIDQARGFSCSNRLCRARGDAADYVAFARGWTEDGALNAIQAFLESGDNSALACPSPAPPAPLHTPPPVFKRKTQTRAEAVFGVRVKS